MRDNFQLYIGSEAKIIYGQETFSCKQIVGICDSLVVPAKKGLIVTIYSGGVDQEFYLDDCKLVLRPMSSVTAKECKEHREMDVMTHSSDYSLPWWEKERLALRSPSERILWWVKKGFDIGLIPEGRFILEK